MKLLQSMRYERIDSPRLLPMTAKVYFIRMSFFVAE